MGPALLHLPLLGEHLKDIKDISKQHRQQQKITTKCHLLTLSQVVVLAPASFYLEEAFEALNFHHDRQVD